MNYTKRAREEYNFHRNLACDTLGITVNQYNWFRRHGEALHKLYEADCNGELTEDKYEEMTGLVSDVVDKKVKELGLNVFYQTDPRGATIYLDKKPIAQNNYSSSYCIY